MEPALLKSYSHFRGNILVVVKMAFRRPLLATVIRHNGGQYLQMQHRGHL
jgi:hypothetical protein